MANIAKFQSGTVIWDKKHAVITASGSRRYRVELYPNVQCATIHKNREQFKDFDFYTNAEIWARSRVK